MGNDSKKEENGSSWKGDGCFMKAISKKKIILFVVLLVLLLAGVLYHIPTRLSGETEAVRQTLTPQNELIATDDTVLLQYDLRVQRYFLKPNKITGSLVVDGEQYADLDAFEARYFSYEGALDFYRPTYTFFKGIQEKFSKPTLTFYPMDSLPDAEDSDPYDMQANLEKANQLSHPFLTGTLSGKRLVCTVWYVTDADESSTSSEGTVYLAELK
jgi:hypothetical protein